MAVNCWVAPCASEVLEGVTAIDVSAGAPTVRGVTPLIGPELAWIVLLPSSNALTSPRALTDATEELLEFHTTPFDTFSVLPSLNVPVAVSC